MSDCDCDHGEEEEQEDEEPEQTYEAFIQAGNMGVQIEGESSEDAHRRVESLLETAVEQVKTLNEEERRSVGLK